MLRAYFDGSGTSGRSITLGCVAGHASVWQEIEPKWIQTLKHHNAKFAHMKELMSLTGTFQQWSCERRDRLIEDLLGQLAPLGQHPQLHSFTCSVDLGAYHDWSQRRKLPKPERICSRMLFPHVFEWYATFPDPIILEPIEAYFDQGEAFMAHMAEDWNHKAYRRRYPIWELVRRMEPADMRVMPPLQVADLIAWARNRLESRLPGERFRQLADRIVNTIHGIHRPVGAKALAHDLWREEGARSFEPSRRKPGR